MLVEFLYSCHSVETQRMSFWTAGKRYIWLICACRIFREGWLDVWCMGPRRQRRVEWANMRLLLSSALLENLDVIPYRSGKLARGENGVRVWTKRADLITKTPTESDLGSRSYLSYNATLNEKRASATHASSTGRYNAWTCFHGVDPDPQFHFNQLEEHHTLHIPSFVLARHCSAVVGESSRELT